MSGDIAKLFDDVEQSIKIFEQDCDDSNADLYLLADLKLKYLMTVALKEIVINLHEISHFGIGTD